MKDLLKVIFLSAAFLSALALPAWSATKEINLKVEGMTCGMCPPKVEAALKGVKGVNSCEVSLEQRSAKVVVEDTVKDEDLVEAVEGAGFKATAEK